MVGKSRGEQRSAADQPPGGPEKSLADKFGVTLSGLLSVLDGFHAPDDVLFLMTTNRIEALDPALLRPGRIDYRLYLGAATEQQKLELFGRFFPHTEESDAREFIAAHADAETMADFQGLLLEFADRSVSLRANDSFAEQEELVPVLR